MAFRYSGSTVLSLLRTKLGAKIAPRWAKMGTREAEMGPRWSKMKPRGSQDEAKNGSKTQVGSTLGRGWADIVHKWPEDWKMAVA